MPRLALALALATLLLGACQTAVERCNAHPDDPECIPDATPVGGLTYRSVQIELDEGRTTSVRLGLCGNFTREVVWLMPGGVPEDGFVVQQVDIESTDLCSIVPGEGISLDHLDACTDPPTVETLPPTCVRDGEPYFERSDVRFWEAFPMEAGAVRYAGRDLWQLFPQAVAEGGATITGAARYYAAADLGDEHPDQPASPFRTDPFIVGQSRLQTTDREPIFWRDDPRPTLARSMRVSWQCCPAMITVIEEDTHDR